MYIDQAAILRKRLHDSTPGRKHTRVITITSGKGGVGKSNFTLNFALSLIDNGHDVAILDADIGLANIDVLMGVSPRYTLQDMMSNNMKIWDIIEKGPNNLKFIAGGSNLEYVFNKNTNFPYVFDQFLLLNGYIDTLLIDTGAGINEESLKFMTSSDEVFIVTTPEPTSITDAYAMIKMIYSKKSDIKISLIINRISNKNEGRNTAKRIQLVTKEFLNFDINIFGYIGEDTYVSKAVKKQQPFYISYPNSKASRDIRSLANQFINNSSPKNSNGVKGFFENMRYWLNR